MSRDEKERRIIDLYYNQGKTTREIIKELRVSPNYVSAILKKEEEKNNNIVTNKQQQSSALATRAYELFSNGKMPLQVAIALNIRQSEAAKYYKEYWKLKRLHKLYLVYTELGDDGLGDFLRLHKLSKKEGISREQVVKLLQLADETNPFGLSQLEKRRKWLIDEIHELDMQIERSKEHLNNVDDKTTSSKQLLNSYHILCERKREEIEHFNNEISRLVTLVNRFKSNNEEYIKIKKTVEEEVSKFLTDGKVLLQFALASVIEAIRRDSNKYNNLLVYNISASSTAIPAQDLPLLHIEDYKDTILEEAKRLYDSLLYHFANSIMDNTAANSSNATKPVD